MRIFFQNGSIPTRAAKRLKEQLGIKDSEARRVTALVLGYRNWADLENTLNTCKPSLLDEECDGDTLQQRRQYQVSQLEASGLDLKGAPVDVLISTWQPSAARPQTPVVHNDTKGPFRTSEFMEALLILQKFREAPVERYAAILLEGIRQVSNPSWLKLAGSIASELLSGERERSPELARQMLEALAEKGQPHAIFNLSTCLSLGDGGPKDEKRAADLLESLVNADTTPEELRAAAKSRLGGIYAGGLRRGTDVLKALKLWEQAAEAGDREAGFNAGLFHQQGRGVPEDFGRAVHFYRLAADKGHVAASTNLGLVLLGRPDLATSFEEAESRLEYSATRGDVHAIEALKAFNKHINKVMRDFDAGRIPPAAFRGVQETILELAKGKGMSEVFKARAPAPKTSPDRQRATRRK